MNIANRIPEEIVCFVIMDMSQCDCVVENIQEVIDRGSFNIVKRHGSRTAGRLNTVVGVVDNVRIDNNLLLGDLRVRDFLRSYAIDGTLHHRVGFLKRYGHSNSPKIDVTTRITCAYLLDANGEMVSDYKTQRRFKDE